jgi:hypothetical protein
MNGTPRMCASVSREPIRITFHAIHAPNHSGSMPSTLHTVLDSNNRITGLVSAESNY